MSSRSISGANSSKRARESKLLALLAPIFRAHSPIRAKTVAASGDVDHGELGWTVRLRRGHDLPPLQLSILPQPGARMALRFDCCARERNEGC
ncbi:hypothetical protein GJ654_15840 [Rhodoblastus acidophilus]|jgi:hypothetical protein|uniref:Uncharacterized protein n=1 Tax=Rhodoblastus acidophilus TaxID=1074 RepID=A0A6N8DPZ1_RHOAC|nr:hypothetical protein [Rhodoblastus acidophilus]MCW2275897.1 hypothetical protein [Rhodoblastus acidophilus]MTV32457.1 hypothetical protein [Rhodoblastus acidophilus]